MSVTMGNAKSLPRNGDLIYNYQFTKISLSFPKSIPHLSLPSPTASGGMVAIVTGCSDFHQVALV